MTFTCTCDKPYDKHLYKIVHDHGESHTFDDYEVLRAYLFHQGHMFSNPIVEVLDKKQRKGFK